MGAHGQGYTPHVCLAPPAPLSGKRPCLVSGGGGGEGTVTFHFLKFLGALDTEVLLCLCLCWLDKVMLSVHVRHCTAPCLMLKAEFLAFSAMNVCDLPPIYVIRLQQ